ncbi:hypothetical protein ACQP10_38215 (plasmid) [Streptosporangium sandarakinum]|uniref:hypothetical protein n=1 Tax=Streptosporangium sandarakinum TaxID=1260955 RepID=UPI003D8FABA2
MYEYTDQVARYLTPALGDLGFAEGRRGGDNFGDLDPLSTRVFRHENIEVAVNEDTGQIALTGHGLDDPNFERGYLWRANFTLDAPTEVIAGAVNVALAQAAEKRSMDQLRASIDRHYARVA